MATVTALDQDRIMCLQAAR